MDHDGYIPNNMFKSEIQLTNLRQNTLCNKYLKYIGTEEFYNLG